MSEVTVGGESFTLRPVAATRVLKFARLASQGVGEGDMESLAAIDDIMSRAVAPEDRGRWEDACDREVISFERMMEVVAAIVEEAAHRPTPEPSVSSDGPSSTNDSSAGGSSSPVIARLEAQGRPDLALIVQQAQASRVSA